MTYGLVQGSPCKGGALIKPEAEDDSQHLDRAKYYLSTPHLVICFNRKAMSGCVGGNAFVCPVVLHDTLFSVQTRKSKTGQINFTSRLVECRRTIEMIGVLVYVNPFWALFYPIKDFFYSAPFYSWRSICNWRYPEANENSYSFANKKKQMQNWRYCDLLIFRYAVPVNILFLVK